MGFNVTIFNRFTRQPAFTAELDAAHASDPADVNLGRAVRQAKQAGAYLAGTSLTGANLAGADLIGANLVDCNLAYADLRGANLAGGNLAGSYLHHADLTDANLSGTYLHGAFLAAVKGLAPERCTPLLMLYDQPGKIRAYKLVTEDGCGPFDGRLRYAVGQSVHVVDANTDPARECAEGINVATLPWCLAEWKPGYRILVVEFEAKDIAAIPTGTRGGFRLHRCTVVGEKRIDPSAMGLARSPERRSWGW